MRDLVPFVQIKKREKHTWRSVTFTKVLKIALIHGGFLRFLNCTNVTKSRNASHIMDHAPFGCNFWIAATNQP